MLQCCSSPFPCLIVCFVQMANGPCVSASASHRAGSMPRCYSFLTAIWLAGQRLCRCRRGASAWATAQTRTSQRRLVDLCFSRLCCISVAHAHAYPCLPPCCGHVHHCLPRSPLPSRPCARDLQDSLPDLTRGGRRGRRRRPFLVVVLGRSIQGGAPVDGARRGKGMRFKSSRGM